MQPLTIIRRICLSDVFIKLRLFMTSAFSKSRARAPSFNTGARVTHTHRVKRARSVREDSSLCRDNFVCKYTCIYTHFYTCIYLDLYIFICYRIRRCAYLLSEHICTCKHIYTYVYYSKYVTDRNADTHTYRPYVHARRHTYRQTDLHTYSQRD